MAKPGPKSTASLSIVPATIERPNPPKSLNRAARAAWLDIVGRMPPHWFLTALPLLEVYCRSIALERELAEALGDLAVGSKEHDELARAWRAQASLIASLSTKLQLSPRSRHDRNIAPRIVPPGRKPWQVLVPQGDGDKPGDGTA